MKHKGKRLITVAAIPAIGMLYASYLHAGPNMSVAYENLAAKVENPSIGLCHAYIAVTSKFCETYEGYLYFNDPLDENSATRRSILEFNIGENQCGEFVQIADEDPVKANCLQN